ncbi:hypothetical protein ACVWXN_004690 [Bradyrhizobium sp. i1.4.4]
MSTAGVISLERDTPELARTYEQTGVLQFTMVNSSSDRWL